MIVAAVVAVVLIMITPSSLCLCQTSDVASSHHIHQHSAAHRHYLTKSNHIQQQPMLPFISTNCHSRIILVLLSTIHETSTPTGFVGSWRRKFAPNPPPIKSSLVFSSFFFVQSNQSASSNININIANILPTLASSSAAHQHQDDDARTSTWL